jgi:hypothetical protein
MSRTNPHCDRHPNLQMVPCLLRRPKGMVAGHVCPVPGCGRYFVEEGYVSGADVELVLAPSLSIRSKNAFAREETQKKKSPSSDHPALNRHAAARAAILKAIDQKQRP